MFFHCFPVSNLKPAEIIFISVLVLFFAPRFASAQTGTGLPGWYFSSENANGIQWVDWTEINPETRMIPGTGPTMMGPCIPAINSCGVTVLIIAHSGINSAPNNLFIFDREGNPLLNNNSPNGPGLNGKKAGYETQVIAVPGSFNEWYIFYPEWKTNTGAPLNNGAYTPAPILYSRVRFSCGNLEVLERDVALKVNNTTHTYTNGMAIGIKPGTNTLCLYIVRRNSALSYLSVDRFLIEPDGIHFDKNTGNVATSYWNLTAESSFIEVSSDGNRLLVLNRNQDTNWDDLFLFDATIFSNAPNACRGICTGDLILQPDNQVLFSAAPVGTLAYNNPNLFFLRNMERKIAEIEFSSSGNYIYFVNGGFVEGYYSNITYLGQIEIGTLNNPAPYPYKLRLQVQEPPGPLDMETGRGGLESEYAGMIKSILYIEKSYDGLMYFIKRDGSHLYSIPEPDDEMPQSLVPGDIDLSIPGYPNIPYLGTLRSVSDQIDGFQYITSISPMITLGNDTVICEGQQVALTPGGQFEFYCWQDGSSEPVYFAGEPGDYWVEVTDGYGCFARDTIEIQTIGVAVDLGDELSICLGDSILLAPSVNFEEYLWQDGSSDASYIVKEEGLYWVEVTAAGGCTSRDSVMVLIHPLPDVDLGPDTLINYGQTILLDAGPGFTAYTWQDGSDAQILEVAEPGAYWVMVSDGFCEATDTVIVIRNDCEATLFIPNCFTPNGDGFNEVFNVKGQNLDSFNMLIFNRWGQMLFETNDPDQGWDGKLSGRLCAQGTYFYLIRYTTPCEFSIGQSGERKGSVTLLE